MGTFAVASATQRMVRAYATGRPQLLSRPVPEQVRRRYNLAFATMPSGYGVLVPRAFFAPRAAIIWLVLLPTGLAATVIRRGVGRVRRKSANGG